jgi:hypothetical protein
MSTDGSDGFGFDLDPEFLRELRIRPREDRLRELIEEFGQGEEDDDDFC